MVSVDIIEMDAQYIHTKVLKKLNNNSFYVTFVYGFNKIEDKASLWQNLIRLNVQDPWIVMGDFNAVMYANERLGGLVKDEEMVPFQDTVAECDLQDLKSYGAFFTWNNKQPSDTRVFSRIDRALVNDSWLNVWTEFYATFTVEGEFDHCPCIISSARSLEFQKKPFKFFNMWCRAPEYHQVVQHNWNINVYGTAMFRVVKRLKLIKPSLKNLNGSLFSDIERNTDVSYKVMIHTQQELQKDPYNKQLMDIER
ncbi:uncharacterized protein LOC141595214 [Silene latifolia]|uniref:uncharacterized protein LOC141595214 n=1 Tax=Silene latifolia TaxID=37657 RepID=UPI003D774DC3